jgi:hypothetical protein
MKAKRRRAFSGIDFSFSGFAISERKLDDFHPQKLATVVWLMPCFLAKSKQRLTASASDVQSRSTSSGASIGASANGVTP